MRACVANFAANLAGLSLSLSLARDLGRPRLEAVKFSVRGGGCQEGGGEEGPLILGNAAALVGCARS